MWGAVSLAAGLLLAGDLDFYGTVIAESRGGQAPQTVNAPPTLGVVGILTPRPELEYRESNLTLHLEYSARIFYRQPNDLSTSKQSSGGDKPLILHTATFSAATRATSTLTMTGLVGASYGQVDYTSQSSTITGGQTTTPAQASLALLPDIFTATARGTSQLVASRRWSIGLGVDVEHRRPVGTQPSPDAAAPLGLLLAPQTSVRGEPGAAYRLSTTDDLLLSSAVSYQHFSAIAATAANPATAPADFFIVTPEAGWRTRLSSRSTLILLGGFSYLHVSGASAPPVNPVGSIDYRNIVIWARDLALQTGGGFLVDYFVDPVLKSAQPRGTITWRAILTFAPDWTAGIEAAFSTSLTSKIPPVPGFVPMPGLLPPTIDTTVASVALPVGHRISKNLLLEFGGRWSDRGTNIWDSNFVFHQRQLWLYVLLTATTRDVPRQSIQ